MTAFAVNTHNSSAGRPLDGLPMIAVFDFLNLQSLPEIQIGGIKNFMRAFVAGQEYLKT